MWRLWLKSDSDTTADANPYPNAASVGNADTDRFDFADTDTDADRLDVTDTNADTNTGPDGFNFAITIPDAHTDTRTDTDAHPIADTDPHRDAYRAPHTDPHRDDGTAIADLRLEYGEYPGVDLGIPDAHPGADQLGRQRRL